ncbi:MAG: hypothetical protein ACFFBD_30470 [Candidatus Hodarchaeota archaeon]
MVSLTKLMDGGPSATKMLIKLAIASFVQLGINLQDITALTPLWSPEGEFLLEVQTNEKCLLFLYHNGEVLLVKEDCKKEI